MALDHIDARMIFGTASNPISARMTYGTMPSDHNGTTMTYTKWHEEHLLNVSVLWYTFPISLLYPLIYA
jgi:hypothetical protein